MKKLMVVVACSMSWLGSCFGVWFGDLSAQTVSRATAEVTATVIAPVLISKTEDLRFGTFSSVEGGSVMIRTSGSRSSTGLIVLGVDGGGAATFRVTGDANTTYSVTLPVSTTISDGAMNSMTVDTFVSNPDTGRLGVAGSEPLAVGGSLNVKRGQPAGSYKGSFDVTVNYN